MARGSATKVLVINPGGTSTKVAMYDGETEIFSVDIRHESAQLNEFSAVLEQRGFRLKKVRDVLQENGVDMGSIDAVVGRGGPVAPVDGGTYTVDEAMLSAIAQGRTMVEHPSLLGAPLAHELAKEAGCDAFIVDPVSVDEFVDESRITGLPSIPRRALSHALNVKAAGRAVARELDRPFQDLNLIVLHLGSGTTVAASRKGRQVDATDASASGPMAPTRSGSLPALDLARLCFSGKYDMNGMKKLMVGQGGWVAHLDTDDVREIYSRIDDGDVRARMVLDATKLQISKEAAAMGAVLQGEVDAIVVTGGIARSERFVNELKPRLTWICPRIVVLPGENEMLALALGAIRALTKECEARSMGPYINKFAKERS